MCCISPLYPESATAISSSFRNETNACRASVISLWPAQVGPWTQTTCPVAMHTPTSYLSPLPLNLWDMHFSENFISTGMSVPSSITSALLPILPKYRLSHTIYLGGEQGMSWLGVSATYSLWEKNLPLCNQGTILLPQIAPTTFDVSFCPLYLPCENCCVQCHKLLRNRAPTANALDERPLALFWMDRFCSKAQSKLRVMHQTLSSISGWKHHSLFEEGLSCPLLHWW